MILVLLNGCMQVFSHERVQCGMPHSLPPAARSHAIAIYQRMPQLWAVLWALKDPWISQWPQYYHPLYESWHILQNAICTVATRSLVLQVEYRYVCSYSVEISFNTSIGQTTPANIRELTTSSTHVHNLDPQFKVVCYHACFQGLSCRSWS